MSTAEGMEAVLRRAADQLDEDAFCRATDDEEAGLSADAAQLRALADAAAVVRTPLSGRAVLEVREVFCLGFATEAEMNAAHDALRLLDSRVPTEVR